MSALKQNLIYLGLFSFIAISGFIIYSNQIKPVVLSDMDGDGFDDPAPSGIVTPSATTTPLTSVTPNPTGIQTDDLKSLYVKKYNDTLANYNSVEALQIAPTRISIEDYKKVKKTVYLAALRDRLMVSEIYTLLEKIEIQNETNQIMYRDINQVRTLIKDSKEKLKNAAEILDGIDNSITSLDKSVSFSTDLADITNRTNDINAILSSIVSGLQFVLPDSY